MPRGVSLHIGLNEVDPNHYGGWSGPLNACEADADDMEAIARSKNFTATKLLTKSATRNRVLEAIDAAAKSLQSGDIFFLTYSGHGGQLPDKNNDEDDGMDETWCLFDGQMVDDELYARYAKFASGVRVLVFSDSCHSGTVTKLAFHAGRAAAAAPATNGRRYRLMPWDAALRTYRQNRSFYDPILSKRNVKESKKSVKATVLLISGCQDNQLSADGAFNGLFTGTLLAVWSNGGFSGDYRLFHKKIVQRMPPDQTPNYYLVGAANAAFEAQQPFTV
jgi:hypothetical protein